MTPRKLNIYRNKTTFRYWLKETARAVLCQYLHWYQYWQCGGNADARKDALKLKVIWKEDLLPIVVTRAGLNRKTWDSLFSARSPVSEMFKSSMHYCVLNEASDIARNQEVVFPQVGSTRDDRSKWPVIKESSGASAEAKGSQQSLGLKDVTKPEGIAVLPRQRWSEWISKDTTKFPEVVTMFL